MAGGERLVVPISLEHLAARSVVHLNVDQRVAGSRGLHEDRDPYGLPDGRLCSIDLCRRDEACCGDLAGICGAAAERYERHANRQQGSGEYEAETAFETG
jgi:hypothetical protein